jgi:hypothetical protein
MFHGKIKEQEVVLNNPLKEKQATETLSKDITVTSKVLEEVEN